MDGAAKSPSLNTHVVSIGRKSFVMSLKSTPSPLIADSAMMMF